MQLVGIAGPAGVGKTTAAKYLMQTRGYMVLSFASPIRAALLAMGVTSSEEVSNPRTKAIANFTGKSPRHLMQTLGTEWGRELIGPDLWVQLLARTAAKVREAGQPVVIDDVRFDNEASWVRSHGTLLHLYGRGGIPGAHASETGVTPKPYDVMLMNNGDKPEFLKRLEQLCEDLLCSG